MVGRMTSYTQQYDSTQENFLHNVLMLELNLLDVTFSSRVAKKPFYQTRTIPEDGGPYHKTRLIPRGLIRI